MYGRDDVELALYALEEGMGAGGAAELVGSGETTVRRWSRGRLPHSVAGCGSLRGGRARTVCLVKPAFRFLGVVPLFRTVLARLQGLGF
uniref:hypothetical protein n=1 Tax=Olsenella uli TaxID=133926 RepID=UPI00325FB89A